MIKIIIPSEFPTQNEIIKAAKSHYGAYANMKKDYTALAMMHFMNKGKICSPVVVHFTWYRKDRRSDPDNISGGQKFILDGIVKAGVLENDGFKQIDSLTHEFGHDKDKPRVEIILRVVE